jgi:hypothetical protein
MLFKGAAVWSWGGWFGAVPRGKEVWEGPDPTGNGPAATLEGGTWHAWSVPKHGRGDR